MIKKLKGIPVWFIAALLIAGTVAGAGLWILTVEVPVDYDEPVQVYYDSEDMDEEFGPVPLRDTRRLTEGTDLTYGTLHDYLRVVNPLGGKDPVELTVEIQAYDDADSLTDDIGFVVIDEPQVEPQNVVWEYDGDGNRVTATYDGEDYDVQYEPADPVTFSHTLDAEQEVEYTVINVVADDVNVDGYEIVWTLYDSTE